MNNKEIKEEILKMIENMEQNTYLLPDNFTEYISFKDSFDTYRTYVQNRGNDRYISINYKQYSEKGNKEYEINIHRDNITIRENDIFNPIKNKVELVYNIIKAIYEEKNSFKENAEGIKKIRQEILSQKDIIKRAKEQINKLTIQIEDYNKLNK